MLLAQCGVSVWLPEAAGLLPPTDQSQRAHEGQKGYGCERTGASRARGIHDGGDAPLDLRRASHRNSGHLRYAPEGAGDFHQLSGVIRCLAAAVQDQVVASPLAFDAHSAGGEPDQRIDPVKGANHPRDGLGQAIPSLRVGEFVQQHDAAPLRRPVRGFGRQQDHRPPPTPRQRHGLSADCHKRTGRRRRRVSQASRNRSAQSAVCKGSPCRASRLSRICPASTEIKPSTAPKARSQAQGPARWR